MTLTEVYGSKVSGSYRIFDWFKKKILESNISIASEATNLIFLLYVKRCFILFDECHCI